MKRLISIVLTLLILATAIPFATAFAAEATYPTTPQEPAELNPYKDLATITDANYSTNWKAYDNTGAASASTETVTYNEDGTVTCDSTSGTVSYVTYTAGENDNGTFTQSQFDLTKGFKISYGVKFTTTTRDAWVANRIFGGVMFGGNSNYGNKIYVGLSSNVAVKTEPSAAKNGDGLRLMIWYQSGKYIFGKSAVIVGKDDNGTNKNLVGGAYIADDIKTYLGNKTMQYTIEYDAALDELKASVTIGDDTYVAIADNDTTYTTDSSTFGWKDRIELNKATFALYTPVHKAKNESTYSNVKLQSKYDAGINLSVTNNLNFNVRLYDLDTENFTAEFIRHGQNGDATETVNVRTTGTYSYFTFSDIAPQCIGDNVSVVIKDGAGNPVYYGYTSIKEYLNTLLNDNQSSGELKTLCKDLLAYGAAARKYKSYGDDSLDSYIDQGASFSTDGAADASVIDTEGKGKWTEGTVVFDSALKLKVKFKADTSVSVTGAKFNGADCNYSYSESDNTYTIASANIYASNLTDDHTFVLTTSNGDTTLTYSLGAYIKYIDSNSADANFKTLVQRTWMFAKAANAYAIAQQ